MALPGLSLPLPLQVAPWALSFPIWPRTGTSCSSGLGALTLWSREAAIGPWCPQPQPALWPPLLTTMEARMGTWMIHFLFPELKSQHLEEGDASAPTPS